MVIHSHGYSKNIEEMDEEGKCDILRLAELLKPPEEPPIPSEDLPKPGSHIKNQNTKILKKDPTPKTIEEFESQELQNVECFDNRKQPLYNIIYRQAVTTEDIFLQMGLKTPLSSSCEDMILTIQLPNETFSAIELNISTKKVTLSGFIYKLDIDLPHSINPDKSNAKWNSDEEVLSLTLRIVRELDYVNF